MESPIHTAAGFGLMSGVGEGDTVTVLEAEAVQPMEYVTVTV
jgi:hypothetical protein